MSIDIKPKTAKKNENKIFKLTNPDNHRVANSQRNNPRRDALSYFAIVTGDTADQLRNGLI